MPVIPVKRINGYPGAVEQRIRYRWSPRTGAETTRKWKGNYNMIAPLLLPLQQGGWEYELGEEDGQYYGLTARIGTSWQNSGLADNPVDVWELTSNRGEKDLLGSNNQLINQLTGPNGANPGDIQVIQFLLLNPPTQPVAVGVPSTDPPTLSAKGLITYNLMTAGVASTTVFAPVVRHTQTVSSIYAVAASVANVGSIYSTLTLQGTMTSAIAIALPLDGSITNSAGLVFDYGWMKDYPNVVTSAFNKTQIIQDWQFGLWSRDLQGNPPL